ncbi:MAG: hypothetical protein JXQ96_15935 [Cyclobacteriaceae bacterium]
MGKGIDVIGRLASSLNRKDEIPNQELAKEIMATGDRQAVQELVDNLSNTKAIQNDCIKVLYEIGTLQPRLTAGHIDDFVALLNSKNNRLQWGAMTAFGTITKQKPKEIYSLLPTIL